MSRTVTVLSLTFNHLSDLVIEFAGLIE